eukprot:Gb_30875 [translate_table: standard]
MAALNQVWDSMFPFMFLFSKFFFFHVMPTRSASRTAAEDAQRRKEQEEEEGMPPYSPFKIGTEGEGLSGGEERGEGSLVTEMDEMKESLRKMEESIIVATSYTSTSTLIVPELNTTYNAIHFTAAHGTEPILGRVQGGHQSV